MTNWIRFAVWLLFGFSIYFGYSYSRSNLTGGGDGKTNGSLVMASIGFLVSGIGLGISAFSFVADLIMHIFPNVERNTIFGFEMAMFVIGLVVGIVGVVLGKRGRE